ncbi:MAG: hypothetical protein K2N17_02040, partial [Clostridia bacterium]|nr:hypothetical protein [Clostridia bacterium]
MFAEIGSANYVSNRFKATCTYSNDLTVNLLPISSPKDINLTYDSTNKWITDLTSTEKPAWLTLDIYNNSEFVSVADIQYTDNVGEDTDKSVTTAQIIEAGTYKVTLKLADGVTWSDDGSTDDKSFNIKIGKKTSTPKPKVDPPISGTPYESAGLPTLVSDTGGTPGTFDWDTGEVASADKTEYSWTFTPTDKNNFTVEKGKMELAFLPRELSGLSVTAYNPTATVYTNTSLATIKGYLTVEASYTDGSTETLTSYKLEVDSHDGKLVAGNNTLVISTNDDSQTITYEITGVVEKAVNAINIVQLSKNTFKYPVTTDEIKAAITRVNVNWNTGASGNLESFEDVTVSGTLNAGNSVTVTIGVSGTTATKNITIKIDKGDFDVSGITFMGDTVTYDGDNHSIEYSGTLPSTDISVEYEYNSSKQGTPWEFANAGTYNITLSFTHSDANYNAITTTLPATLQIDKADYPGADGIKFEGATVTYDEAMHKLEATDVPTGVTVTYVYNGSAPQSTPFEFDQINESGYTVTAKFSHTNGNYKDIADKTAKLTISAKPTYNMDGVTFENETVTYDEQSHTLVILGDLPDGVTVKYYVGEEEFTGATIVGDYVITAKFTGSDEYAPIDDKTATLKINQAEYDMSGVEFKDKTFTYDGETHSIYVGGVELPDWITVTYTGNEVAEVGTHTVVAKFTHDNGNYKTIADKTATLIISDAVITEIKAELSEKDYTTANTLDDLKAKLTVTAIYNNDTTAEIEEYELSCNGLSDGGKFKFGLQKITVKYVDESGIEHSTFVEIRVEKEKVALPTFKGGLSYTGVSLKPKAADFNGYDESLMTFVAEKTVAGLNAGAYKAVFALNDPENYEWATAKTLKKTVFAVAVYDEMVLNANEAAVDWNISKAVLTATKTDGGLPVFASDSYIGAFADVVTLKYYKDEACTEEVAADQLAKETQYYVKAELIDTDNFELDASAAQYTVKSFTYTTPAKELTLWDKIVKFVVTNWLWLVIAVAALILLILIIALAARSAKKKREREEQRRLEEKEERKREQEERERREEERRQREDERRREEREERMAARMAQPQMMMPQMPQMPPMQAQQAPQPQYAPQAAPSVSDSALLISIENQLSALRSEQTAATRLECEMAKLRADLKVGQPLMTDANTGKAVTVDTLTEIITLALKSVLTPNAQQAAEQKEESAKDAAPVCPPDAVMTTVTTTKIDTTKKPAQTAD